MRSGGTVFDAPEAANSLLSSTFVKAFASEVRRSFFSMLEGVLLSVLLVIRL